VTHMVHNSICSRPGGKLVRIDEAEYEQLKTLLSRLEGPVRGDTGYWSLEHGVSNELIAAIVTHMERSQDDLG
jgi:hypothetical protein